MKGFKTLLGLGLLTVSMAWVLLPGVAESVIPERINIQGILKDAGGNPVADGAYSVIFTIYNADIGGTVFWAETTSVATAGGLFNYRMGAANAIPDTAIRLNTWLGIAVGADPEMTPRTRLTSVSHAYKVSTVTGASGGVVTGDIYLQGAGADDYLGLVSSDPNVALDLRSGTSGGDPYIDFSNDAASDYDARIQLQGNDGLQITVPSILSIPTGNVGIGTTSPTKKLDVVGSVKADTVFSNNLSSNSPLNLQAPAGIIRVYVDDVSGNVGIGTTAPEARVTSNYSAAFAGSDVAAFLGTAENTSSGQAYGGYFNVSSAGTGTHYGVRSEVSAASGTASSYGLFARNNATTASIHYGIVGHATGVGPVQNRALEGVASGATGLNIGVRGSASGTGAYSGRFENATVKVGSAGTETIVDGNGDLYLQDELEVDGIAAFAADVGIGTTTPGSRLHVLEDINSAAVLTIENPNTGTASGERIQFDSEDGSGTGGGAFIAVFDNTSGSTPNGMRIANNLTSGDIDFLTAGSVKMTIDNGGNVGIGTGTPNSKLDVQGPIATAVVTTASSITLGSTHSVVLCTNLFPISITISLPTAVGIAGRQYTIKRTGTTVTVDPAVGGQTIDGAASYVIPSTDGSITVVSDGTNWFILSGYLE